MTLSEIYLGTMYHVIVLGTLSFHDNQVSTGVSTIAIFVFLLKRIYILKTSSIDVVEKSKMAAV